MSAVSRATRAVTALLCAGVLVGLVEGPALAAGPSAGAGTAGDPYFPMQGNGGYDVGHYDLSLRFTPSSGMLEGNAVVQATATQALSRFDLDPRSRRPASSR